MRASKENARKAIEHVEGPIAGVHPFVLEFLRAAEAKLPSEEAYEADAVRKSAKKGFESIFTDSKEKP